MADIELRQLTKRFGSVVAVDNLTFDVEAGTVTGFLGPNGAGKSTALRTLLGLVRPSSGAATFGGRAYADLAHPLRAVGAVLDTDSFHPGRSGRNHLRVMATAAGLTPRRVDEVLDMVGLTEPAGRKVGQYSLGMRQRLGLAGALLGDPRALVLDEPANGLDPEGIRWLRQFLRYLADEGRTVLVSSHLLAEMASMADHVLIIAKGRLVTSSSLAELSAGRSESVQVRSPRAGELAEALVGAGHRIVSVEGDHLVVAGASSAAVGELAAERGLALHELRPEAQSLEEIFLELTAGAPPGPAGYTAAPVESVHG